MPRILHAIESRSLRGRLSSFDRAALSLRLADDYAQLPSLSTLPSPTPNEHVSDVRYDDVGALLVSCSSGGCVAIHQAEQLADRTEPSDASPTCWDASGDNDAGPDPFAPIFSVQTGERSVAVRWDPRRQNEVACASSSSGDVSVYDIAAARPERRTRVLRSAEGAPQGGLADLAHLRGGELLAAGGRDGGLRVWDVRAPGPVVRQAKQLTSGWTLGRRAADSRAGAIVALAAAADGEQLLAATEEGSVLVWDVRALSATRCTVRAAHACGQYAAGTATPIAAEGLLAHPAHPRAALVLFANGALCAIDTLRQAVTASCDAPGAAPAAAVESGPVGELRPIFVAAGGHVIREAAPRAADWRVKGRRLAWVCDGEFAAVGQRGGAALHLMRLSRDFGELSLRLSLPTSAPVVAPAAHPRAPFVAVGLADNRLGLLHPVGSGSARRVEREAAAEARRAQYDAEAAAAETAAAAEAEAAAAAAEAAGRAAMERARRDAEAEAARRDAWERAEAEAAEAAAAAEARSEYEARAREREWEAPAPRPALHRAEAGAQNRGAAGPAEAKKRRIDDFFGPAWRRPGA